MYEGIAKLFHAVSEYINDRLAKETWYSPAGITETVYRDEHGKLHRDYDKPAKIYSDSDTGVLLGEEYYQHGRLHRAGDQPAMVHYNPETGAATCQHYYQHGQLHRENGKPAVITYDDKTGAVDCKVYAERGSEYRPKSKTLSPPTGP